METEKLIFSLVFILKGLVIEKASGRACVNPLLILLLCARKTIKIGWWCVKSFDYFYKIYAGKSNYSIAGYELT